MKKVLTFLLLAALFSAPFALAEIIDENDNDSILANLEEVALNTIAGQLGLEPTSLELVNAAHATTDLTGVTVFSYKVVSADDGMPYVVDLDRDGKQADMDSVMADEKAAYLAAYGRLDIDLANKVESSSPTDMYEVLIWLEEPDTGSYFDRLAPEDEVDEQVLDEFYTALDMSVENEVRSLTQAFLDQTGGGENYVADTHAPVVYATISGGEVQSLRDNPMIGMVYEATNPERMAEVARQVVEADQVEATGNTGAGIRVGLTEVGGLIHNANPYLNAFQRTCSGAYLHPHGTYVAGIIQSSHSSIRGAAPSSTIYYGGGSTGSQLQCASTFQANSGARTFNLSWGSYSYYISSTSNFYDNMVRNRYRTVVVAAGNSGGGPPANPSNAYNVISVGAYDDHDTVYRSDDSMAGFSSYRNPYSRHGDRIKPEVAAPGVDIKSTIGGWPWVGTYGSADGTSYAAPWVTGLSALMMRRHLSLTVWPESVKAILMATAWHNIEGSRRLSNRDGAGGVEGMRAVNVAGRQNGNWGGIYYNCSSAYTRTLTSFQASNCERTRVAIAWDTNPSYSRYYGSNSRPSADLDLIVRRGSPTGPVVAASSSWDNTYEIVDFTPTVSTTYYVQVRKYRCSSSPNWLGWSWSQ